MNNEQIIEPLADLRERWKTFREENPDVRIRDAATRMGVSEAELVATGCGTTVTRIGDDWPAILTSLEPLGPIMSLTRNDHAVHEKKGIYRKVSIEGAMGLALDEDIDLRFFMVHWHFGFAVIEETTRATRRSLQFFDQDGTAIHKIYLQDEGSVEEFNAVVDRFRHENQDSTIQVQPVTPDDADLPDEEIDFAGLYDTWRSTKDTHEFFGMLRKFKVGRVQALRNAPADLARRLSLDSFRRLLEMASEEQLPIMIFVGSPGVIQIHTGPVNRVVETGPWFNVLDPGFNLHLREDHIASAWMVSKVTDDGFVTSVELFDEDGKVIALMFGKRKPGQPEDMNWRALASRLPDYQPA